MIRWRSYVGSAVLVSAAFVARTALDWLQPTSDFHLRSAVSTLSTAAIFTLVGSLAAWRSGTWIDGPVATFVTALLAALFSLAGVSALYAFRHDRATLDAMAGSGGLAEALFLPVFLTLPAALLGVLGGICGAAARAVRGPAAPAHGS